MKSDLVLTTDAKEKVNHKINTNFRMFINRLHSDFPPHWHSDIEIILPKDAPYRVVCGNRTYDVEIGDIILICPAVLHEIFSPSPGSRVYIQADFSGIITLKELEESFRLMSPALHISKKTCPEDIYGQLIGYIDMIMKLYFGSAQEQMDDVPDDDSIITFTELEPYGELEIYSILMQFISYCAKNIILFQGVDTASASGDVKNRISLSNVCAYIADHFTEDLSLESIAAYAGFSKFHFERIFREYTGMTYYQYLQQMRIGYAQTLLSNPGLNVTDIAGQAGFASCAAFTRAFKKSTGYAPSRFRMLNEERHPLNANPHFANFDDGTR